MDNGDKIKTHERLAVVETQVKAIINNHLPHIEDEVRYVKKRLNWVLGLLVGGLISILILLVSNMIM